MPKPKFEIHERKDSREAKLILKGLTEFNRIYKVDRAWRELTISLKDEKGSVIAGLNGYSSWGWMFIKLLWVSEKCRGEGIGYALMKAAEKEAKKRKCIGIWLDTFSFQALKFYKKLGYREFGKIKNFPKNFNRHFLTKNL